MTPLLEQKGLPHDEKIRHRFLASGRQNCYFSHNGHNARPRKVVSEGSRARCRRRDARHRKPNSQATGLMAVVGTLVYRRRTRSNRQPAGRYSVCLPVLNGGLVSCRWLTGVGICPFPAGWRALSDRRIEAAELASTQHSWESKRLPTDVGDSERKSDLLAV